jgi:hypothetical protein
MFQIPNELSRGAISAVLMGLYLIQNAQQMTVKNYVFS